MRLRADGADPSGGGPRWALVLQPLEERLLRDLPARLEAVLADPERNAAVIGRLFPRSYEDAEEEREHRRLLGGSLLAERRGMIADVRARLARMRPVPDGAELPLTRRDLDLWLRFVNDVRMVLATDLGIERNGELERVDWSHPRAAEFAVLAALGGLEMLLLSALAPHIPTEGWPG